MAYHRVTVEESVKQPIIISIRLSYAVGLCDFLSGYRQRVPEPCRRG
jgi:hypothetical protein